MSGEQLRILQHAVGADKYGRRERYCERNHFCAGPGDEEVCRELVALGYAEQFERAYLPYFNITITDAGKRAMREGSPNPPKLSRSQKRYREFLHADTGRSFIEWLKDQSRGNDVYGEGV